MHTNSHIQVISGFSPTHQYQNESLRRIQLNDNQPTKKKKKTPVRMRQSSHIVIWRRCVFIQFTANYAFVLVGVSKYTWVKHKREFYWLSRYSLRPGFSFSNPTLTLTLVCEYDEIESYAIVIVCLPSTAMYIAKPNEIELHSHSPARSDECVTLRTTQEFSSKCWCFSSFSLGWVFLRSLSSSSLLFLRRAIVWRMKIPYRLFFWIASRMRGKWFLLFL